MSPASATSAIDALALGRRPSPISSPGAMVVDGDTAALRDFFGLLDTSELWVDIVTP